MLHEKMISDKKSFFYQNGEAGKCIIQPVDEHYLAMLEWNPGNHFAQPDIRTAKGFAWLLAGE